MMILYFPPFRAADADELLRVAIVAAKAYVEDLAEFDTDTLERGWREVRRGHKTERWPTIETIRKECLNAGPLKVVDIHQKRRLEEAEAKRKVAVMVEQYKHNGTGVKAAQEGWLLALIEFLKKHEREPTDYELEDIKRGVERRRQQAESGFPDIVLHRDSIVRVHDHWEKKNAALCQEVLSA